MPKMHDPSQDGVTPEYLHELLKYDESKGLLTWRHTRSGRARAGAEAGYVPKQQNLPVMVRIDGRAYSAARIIIAMKTGKWPMHPVRYRDGNPDNLRFHNLAQPHQLDMKHGNKLARARRRVNSAAIRSFENDPIDGMTWLTQLGLKQKFEKKLRDPHLTEEEYAAAMAQLRDVKGVMRDLLRARRNYLRDKYPEVYPTDIHKPSGRPARGARR